jgi:hypothetical protein
MRGRMAVCGRMAIALSIPIALPLSARQPRTCAQRHSGRDGIDCRGRRCRRSQEWRPTGRHARGRILHWPQLIRSPAISEPAFTRSSAWSKAEPRPSIFGRRLRAVAVTYIKWRFRQWHAVPGLGFLLSNEMDNFASRPGAPNALGLIRDEENSNKAGKRPVSSMVPTVILRDGKRFMTARAPGGSRIPTTVLRVILNVLDFGMNV